MKFADTHRFIIQTVFMGLLCIACVPTLTAQQGWRRLLDERCYGIAINPKNPNTIYVGGESRIIYRSYTAGRTWDTLVVEFEAGSTQFTNILVHPVDTNVVFVGGIRFGNLRRNIKMGEGDWEVVLETGNNMTFSGEAVVFDPTDSLGFRMYAAEFQRGMIYRSTNRGRSWDTLSRLPADSGFTPPRVPRVCSITVRPDSSNVIFVGCTSSKIFRSNDGGRTWRLVQKLVNTELNDTEVPQILFSSTTPMVGYAVATYFYYRYRPNGGMYQTTDGGETWKLLAFADTSLWAIAARPFGAGNELFVGGYTDFFEADTVVAGARVLRRSTDDGKTWIINDDYVPWDTVQTTNVFAMRYAGSGNSLKLYAATEAGFFVFDSLANITPPPPPQRGGLSVSQRTPTLFSVQYEALRQLDKLPELVCYNVLGERVYSSQMRRLRAGTYFDSAELGNIPQGVYFFVVVDDTELITSGVVIGR
ncbi:MAG: hypothetical protein JNL32_08510 [Candidatus Kapabacteria bacterium]|nr:hypothetical protein [Candidatus Kapabacteria bacterium]